MDSAGTKAARVRDLVCGGPRNALVVALGRTDGRSPASYRRAYGLFTILVLGESIAAATLALGEAMGGASSVLLFIFALGGLITVCSLWWIYFDFSTGRAPERKRGSQYVWGYVHYFVFASIAAVGAGLALGVSWLADPDHIALEDWHVAMVVGGSVAVLLADDAHHRVRRNVRASDVFLKLSASILAMGAASAAPLITVSGAILAVGLVLAALVTYGIALQHRLHPKG